MVCKNCGTRNPDNATFCRKCGTRLVTHPNTPPTDVPAGPMTPVNPQRRRKHRLIATTRKTSNIYLVPNLVTDVLVNIILAYALFVYGDKLSASFWPSYRQMGALLTGFGYIQLIEMIVSMCYHTVVSRAYLDIFEDHISGLGLQGIQCKQFNLRLDQITGIDATRGFLNIESGSGIFLLVHTRTGNYKIITTQEKANEILEHNFNARYPG